ncbi:MAG: hypothetical protein ACRD3W_14840 [Terriglobales bacterium]
MTEQMIRRSGIKDGGWQMRVEMQIAGVTEDLRSNDAEFRAVEPITDDRYEMSENGNTWGRP